MGISDRVRAAIQGYARSRLFLSRVVASHRSLVDER